MATLHALLTEGSHYLTPSSDSPQLDAALLLQHVLNVEHSFLYAHPQYCLSTSQVQCFQQLLTRRRNGEPMAYILGHKEFWSSRFKVTSATLVPRPETELLVELTLALLGANEAQTIVDLGTGCGAIALSLAKERPTWRIIACDCSVAALQLAAENAANLAIRNVEFIHSDWFLQLPNQCYHAIISNPPYLAHDDPHLQHPTLQYEPQSALISPDNGLKDLAHIIKHAPNYLITGGHLLVEHGHQQHAALVPLFKAAGFVHCTAHRDLAHHERVTSGVLNA